MERRENEMTGERCLNGDLRCLEVASFADHDPIRVLPQKRAQYTSEGEPDCFVNGNLNDSVQIVFNRLFRGQQFGIDRVDFAQARIKRRRFSRTGWTGGNENSVWPIDDFENVIVDVFRQAKHFEIEIHGRAIEHAQNNAFAELGWQS